MPGACLLVSVLSQLQPSTGRAFSPSPRVCAGPQVRSASGTVDPTCLCFQGSSTKEYFLQRTLQSLERYFYLIAFNYYLHEQVKKTPTPPAPKPFLCLFFLAVSCSGREGVSTSEFSQQMQGVFMAGSRLVSGQGVRAQADSASPAGPPPAVPPGLCPQLQQVDVPAP